MTEPIGAAEELAYELLLEHPGGTLTELTAAWSGPGRLPPVLERLVAIALASELPGARYTAASPDVVAGLLDGQEAALDRAHAQIQHLADLHRAARAGANAHLVEVVSGHHAVRLAVTQVLRSARRELCCFDIPPYGQAEDTADTDRELLAAGVRYRCVYDRAAVEESGGLREIEAMTRAGQQARVLPGLPMKLYLADDRRAILPLPPGPDGEQAAIVVHAPILLDALAKLFDALWDRAVPLHLPTARTPAATTQRVTDIDDDRLVVMLLSGLTDEAIARQIGVGYRTMQRRIAALMTDLGAHTRFQAGVQAAFRQQRASATEGTGGAAAGDTHRGDG
ncbi:transcriptional regulator TrmB [Kribbella shirazensis]|uniref:HTH luxR-type domain-containing protein n=1 Tax=Kribbella shirazensis TaxID=1105143 RepID=A0A7X5V669_9ACTN|nr:transcriptional regulator TrmB [Kribbella shirazensis]NIK55378.1 hypothetical protein [Kribbella shirazensis]